MFRKLTLLITCVIELLLGLVVLEISLEIDAHLSFHNAQAAADNTFVVNLTNIEAESGKL
jgi:hypothetical protein